MTLVQASARGVRWTSLSMVIVTTIGIIRLVVLGRILGPEDFGLLAMMLVVTGFVQMLGQMGLSEAIIQQPHTTHNEMSSLYWLNIAIGVLLYTVLSLCAPLIAGLYSTPELERLLPWLAMVCLISPWGSQFKALLQKQLQFKPLAIIEILAAISGMLLAISLALTGYGVWSLLWGTLTQGAVMALSLVLVAWHRKMLPGMYFSLRSIKPYLSFGSQLLGANILNYINVRVDQLVVGVLLGSQALGYYSMAFNLVLQPVASINPVLTRVAFPVLVRVRSDPARLKRGYFRMLNLLTSVNAPMLIGFAVVAPLLIPLLLGDQWSPVVNLIQVLALFSLIRSTGNAGGSLLLACGRADIAFYLNLIKFIFIPSAVFIGANLGALQGVAWMLLGLQILLFFAWYYFIVRRLLGDCFRGFISSMSAPLLFSLPMALAVIGIAPHLSALSPVMQLIIQILLGSFIYIGLYLFFRMTFVKEQFKLLFNR